MKRASLALCAMGGFLALLGGCTGLEVDFALPAAETVGSVRVVDGSPETVAVALQTTLQKQGLEVAVISSADPVIVEGKTNNGLVFALVLKAVRGADGREQTQIAIEWKDHRQDQQTVVQILTEVDRQSRSKQ